MKRCPDPERIAYVGTKSWEQAMVKVSTLFTKSAIRYFEAPQMEAATAWIRET